MILRELVDYTYFLDQAVKGGYRPAKPKFMRPSRNFGALTLDIDVIRAVSVNFSFVLVTEALHSQIVTILLSYFHLIPVSCVTEVT